MRQGTELFKYVNVRPVTKMGSDNQSIYFFEPAIDLLSKSKVYKDLKGVKGKSLKEIHAVVSPLLKLLDKSGEIDHEKSISLIQQTEELLSRMPEADVDSETLSELFGLVDLGLLYDRLLIHTLALGKKGDDYQLVRRGIQAIHYLNLLSRYDAKKITKTDLGRITRLADIDVVIPSELAFLWQSYERGSQSLADAGSKMLNTFGEYKEIVQINEAIDELTFQQAHREQEFLRALERHDAQASEKRRAVLSGMSEVQRVKFFEAIARGNVSSLESSIFTSKEKSEPKRKGSKEESEPQGKSVDADDNSRIPDRNFKPYDDKFVVLGGDQQKQRNTKERISGLKKNVLDKRESRFRAMSAVEIIEELKRERYIKIKQFLTGLPIEQLHRIRSTPEYAKLIDITQLPFFDFPPLLPPTDNGAKPTEESENSEETRTDAAIKLLGVGELLVVKEKLIGEIPNEIAHIENVMQSEFRERMHARTRETEEKTTIRTEHEEERERDLQSSDRFKLQKEVSKEQTKEMSLEAGLSVSSYGMVKVEASTDFSLSQSTTESVRSSSSYAKELTERSLSRVREQVRSEKQTRTLERVTEKNLHEFKNTTNDDVIGVYRWVDKEYQAYVINYGSRIMVEGIIPEPAAFYLYAKKNHSQSRVSDIPKPRKPTVFGRPLRARDLHQDNYMDFIQEYKVDTEGLEPYPIKYINVGFSKTKNTAQDGNKFAFFADKYEELSIPEGYNPGLLHGECHYSPIGYLQVYVAGREAYTHVNLPFFPGMSDLLGEEDRVKSVYFGREVFNSTLPISVNGMALYYDLNLVVSCERTPQKLEKWQLSVYKAIMAAYKKALLEYSSQVAYAQTRSGVDIQGQNPTANRETEQLELKKGMLRLITRDFARTEIDGQVFLNESFDAMRDGSSAYGYPQFDVYEAYKEGKIIQFFEQAFEWHNMTYRFYPYHWSREKVWPDKLVMNDVDPKFADFLKAGAARVNLPIRPEYVDAVSFYLATGAIFNGGQPPLFRDPLFVSIAAEMKEDAGADVDLNKLTSCHETNKAFDVQVDPHRISEIDPSQLKPVEDDASPRSRFPCLKDTYRYRLPTTLVYLQNSQKLNPTREDEFPDEESAAGGVVLPSNF